MSEEVGGGTKFNVRISGTQWIVKDFQNAIDAEIWIAEHKEKYIFYSSNNDGAPSIIKEGTAFLVFYLIKEEPLDA